MGTKSVWESEHFWVWMVMTVSKGVSILNITLCPLQMVEHGER